MDYDVAIRNAVSIVWDRARKSHSSSTNEWPGLNDFPKPNEIRGATVFREIRAGLTTFATMAYIIAVNVRIVPDSRGCCTAEG